LLNDFKGNTTSIDFENKHKTNKIPFCKSDTHSGAIHESINSFLSKYNRARIVNNWNDDQKKLYLPTYLKDTALKFYENVESNNSKTSWEIIEKVIRLEFEPTAQNYMLRIMTEKKKQLSDKSVALYIDDVENLCKRVDLKMSQSELVYIILKGLKPQIARYIGILENNSLDDLKKNIGKYESIEFMINGISAYFSDGIRTKYIEKEHNII